MLAIYYIKATVHFVAAVLSWGSKNFLKYNNKFCFVDPI